MDQKGMFLHGSKRHVFAPTPSVGVVHIYVGVRESRSWEHDKSLNKGQQDLTRLDTKQAAHVESIKNHVKHIWLR